MSNIIKFIRGAEADIPVLNQGEPAFTTDTHKVFIGDGAANYQLAMITDVEGEANTASNIGSQIEIFKQKTDVDLEFKTLKAGSTKLTVVDEQTAEKKEYNEAGSSEDNINDPTYWYGQYWTVATGYTLDSIKVWIKRVGNPGDIICEVKAADVNHKPTGDVLATKTLTQGEINTDYAWVSFAVGPCVLSDSTEYCFYFKVAGAGPSDSYYWTYSNANPLANAAYLASYDSGSAWSVEAGLDRLFQCFTATLSTDYITLDIDPSKIKLTDLISPHFDSTLADDHTYSGLTDSQPVGETVAFGDLLYFDWAAIEWKKAKANAVGTTPAMRIALEAKDDGEVCLMLVQGYIRDDSAFQFTAAIGYLSIATAGAVQYAVPSVAGNQVQRVGIGISADIMYFNPSMDVGEI